MLTLQAQQMKYIFLLLHVVKELLAFKVTIKVTLIGMKTVIGHGEEAEINNKNTVGGQLNSPAAPSCVCW